MAVKIRGHLIDWVFFWQLSLLGFWIFSCCSWLIHGIVTDRDLLSMMLVFIMNAIIFTISVSIRACGHRCGRKKKIVEEEDDDREYELDLDTFDKTQPIPRPSTTTTKELTGAQKLAGFARKTFGKNNAEIYNK